MEFATLLLQYVTQGGAAAVIALLFGVVGLLVWDRKRLIETLNQTTQRVYDAKDSETKSIKEIVDRYHKGNVDLVQALNEIKVVLVTIQARK
jgi:hypothetical protein